jgi:hypothetical protein
MKKYYFLALSLLTLNNYAQTFLNNDSIFDFSIGDQFHRVVQLNNNAPTHIKETITGKVYSSASDTVIYTVNVDTYQLPSNSGQGIQYINSIETRKYRLAESPHAHTFSRDSAFADNNLYNKRNINEYYEDIGDTDEPHTITTRFIEGCGMGYYQDSYPHEWYNYTSYLVYFKKGSETWGAPLTTRVAELNHGEKSFSVFPNPTNGDNLTFQYRGIIHDTFLLSITDALGRKIRDYQMEDNSIVISLSGIENGVYFYSISENANLINRGKLILEK